MRFRVLGFRTRALRSTLSPNNLRFKDSLYSAFLKSIVGFQVPGRDEDLGITSRTK